MVKRDPDFMYNKYHSDSSVAELVIGVSKTLFPLERVHPNVFRFTRRMIRVPRHVQSGERVSFNRIVDCMHFARDNAIQKILDEHILEEMCLFLCYEAKVDSVEVDILSKVAMNSAWRRFKGWLAADN